MELLKKFLFCEVIAIILIMSSAAAVFSQTKAKGTITGTVREKATKSPLYGVNVVVEGTEKGSATDTSGYFIIHSLPVGTYNLQFSYISFRTLKKANVVVNPNRHTFLEVELEESALESEEIVITPTYFEKPTYALVSNRSMDFEEIRSDPGSAEDIQRVVQALPGIVSGSDQINEIIVRGGNPGENLFVMDNIEIPNPNHFGIPGVGGGPINMINTFFVRDLDFYAGAFPAKFGDKVSSVLDIKLRDGSREEITGNFYLGMAGAGALIEGPVMNGKASYLLSARKSFLDLIISSTGLTAVPKYYNLQGKVSYFISDKNKLIMNGVYGSDRITIESEKTGYTRGAENVKSRGNQYAVGATLQTLWGMRGFSNVTVSRVLNYWNYLVYDKNNYVYHTDKSDEAENALKVDFEFKLRNQIDFSAGMNFKNVVFNHHRWSDRDTVYVYDYPDNPEKIVDIYRLYPEWSVDKDISTYKFGLYSQMKFPFKKIDLNCGIRYNYFDYSSHDNLSSRLGLTYHINPSTNLNVAYGSHYQSPSYIELTSNPANKLLEHKNTSIIILGVEHHFQDDFKGTLEVYYKDYRHVPIPYSWTTPDPLDSFEGRMVSEGRGFTKGCELFLQKKLSQNWHGTVSYSFSVSRAFDPRYNEYFNWDYDFRHVFTFIAGYKAKLMFSPWYQNMSKSIWFKTFAWILPFADEVVTSVRFRYLGGRPRTGIIYHPEFREWLVDEDLMLNRLRYPHYARLDLRIDKRFFFDNWNITTYFDMMNVFNRDNIWEYSHNSDGTIEKILQFQVFPVGGLTIEF